MIYILSEIAYVTIKESLEIPFDNIPTTILMEISMYPKFSKARRFRRTITAKHSRFFNIAVYRIFSKTV